MTIKSFLYKASGVILFASIIFTIISLLTYSETDPSMFHSTGGLVKNWGGALGANISDIASQSIGYAVFYILLFVSVLSLRLIKGHSIPFVLIRLTVLLITLPLLCGTVHLIAQLFKFNARHYSGFLGDFIAIELSQHFSNKLLLIVLGSLSIIGVIFSIGIKMSEWKSIALKLFKLCQSSAFFIKRSIKLLITKKNVSRDDANIISDSQLKKRKPKLSFQNDGDDIKSEEVEIVHFNNAGNFTLPDTDLLKALLISNKSNISKSHLESLSIELSKVLQDFGINAELIGVSPGPVVTLYEFEPSAGTKSSRVIGLADDIARSMKAISARISVIPGKNAIGIELPNVKRETVYLREMLESKQYKDNQSLLPLILGKNISGSPVIADLAKMPHLLVAGTTGSGKSVAINTMILSLLYKHSPETCKFVMIDPKMLELSVYDGIPHLLSPVVTDPKKAVIALKWVVKEMEERYKAMSTLGVRNIAGYNSAVMESIRSDKPLTKDIQTGFDRSTGKPIFERITIENKELPYIVVIVDEMADLMLVAGKDIESYIQRLAQMARAAGIHIIMATQRPSVDVITGVIKANFPTRVSFQVTSRIDSRTILGEQGAEQLLGMGDMLYMMPGGKIERVHGPFVDDKEVESVVQFCKAQGEPNYLEEITVDDSDEGQAGAADGVEDDLYRQALEIIMRDRKVSTSYIQRCLRIGYNRAAIIIEKMEKNGVISPPNHVGKREILS